MGGICGKEAATQRVPVISLHTVLSWLPTHNISFVKVHLLRSNPLRALPLGSKPP